MLYAYDHTTLGVQSCSTAAVIYSDRSTVALSCCHEMQRIYDVHPGYCVCACILMFMDVVLVLLHSRGREFVLACRTHNSLFWLLLLPDICI